MPPISFPMKLIFPMKTSKTFSIESTLFEKFDEICKQKNLNRSQWIEDKIKAFVAQEIIFDATFYKLRWMDDDNYVTIKDRQDNFVILDNGNRIDVFDFEKLYEASDPRVKQVQAIINPAAVTRVTETINPQDFFQPLGTPEQIKTMFEKIDLTNPEVLQKMGNEPVWPEITEHIPVDLDTNLKDQAKKMEEWQVKHNADTYETTTAWLQELNTAMKDLNLPEIKIEKDEAGNIIGMSRKSPVEHVMTVQTNETIEDQAPPSGLDAEQQEILHLLHQINYGRKIFRYVVTAQGETISMVSEKEMKNLLVFLNKRQFVQDSGLAAIAQKIKVFCAKYNVCY